MKPPENIPVNARVRCKRTRLLGVLGSSSADDIAAAKWDDDKRTWQEAEYWDDIELIHTGPGIGAAVAMVAASQVRWIVWGRFIGSREWVAFEAWGTQDQAAAREKYNSGARHGVEFRVLPKGVQP